MGAPAGARYDATIRHCETAPKGTMQPSDRLQLRRTPGRLVVVLTGDWTREQPFELESLLARLEESLEGVRAIAFDASGLGRWDSVLVLLLRRIERLAESHAVTMERDGLPRGGDRLLRLAAAVPEQEAAGHQQADGLLLRIGLGVRAALAATTALLRFTGEATLAFGRLLTGRARFSGRDLLLFIQAASYEALPIVSLISFLIGMILAFVGVVQLEVFGAEIYVANLIGISVTREMGAIMVAVIMAGRTGAAYAAQLGSMQVNEEIDALVTLGLPPMEYLVLPRILALTLMMPLLVVYADVVGIVGGLVASLNLSTIGLHQFLLQTAEAVGLADVLVGIFKGAVFGLLVASAGCYHGLRSGRSSASVGRATTDAVVMSVVAIVVADAVITVVTTLVGI